MYSFVFSPKANLSLTTVPEKTTSFPTTFTELANNPKARSKKTNIPAIGEYYVNSGRFCILFDLDEINQIIIVYGIVRSEYLHKIITGRINLLGN
ncbi:MAG: hypothetical protein ABI741_04140 [Ferruginibacter sp.]